MNYAAHLPKKPGAWVHRETITKPVQLISSITHFNGIRAHLVQWDDKIEWIADHQLIRLDN